MTRSELSRPGHPGRGAGWVFRREEHPNHAIQNWTEWTKGYIALRYGSRLRSPTSEHGETMWGLGVHSPTQERILLVYFYLTQIRRPHSHCR